jgi:hypothetical protein
MRTRRTGRIGPTEADELVAGQPARPEWAGLDTLLAAAAAPGSAEELAGERAAVAGFAAAYRGAVPTTVPASRRVRLFFGRAGQAGGLKRPALSTRTVAVTVAAGVAVLVAGGAFAAETGRLPAPVQHRAHAMFASLGVPGPGTSQGPAASGSASPIPVGSSASSVPGAGASGTPSVSASVALCQVWDAAQNNPHGKAVPAETRHALAALAGGEPNITAYCAGVLAGASPTPTPTPTQTTKGNGKAKPKPTKSKKH